MNSDHQAFEKAHETMSYITYRAVSSLSFKIAQAPLRSSRG